MQAGPSETAGVMNAAPTTARLPEQEAKNDVLPQRCLQVHNLLDANRKVVYCVLYTTSNVVDEIFGLIILLGFLSMKDNL